VTLGVMNVIIGMICDSVLSKAQELQMTDHHKVRNGKLRLLERLHVMLEKMDINEDGRVDAEELKKAINRDPELLDLIESVDLPEGFSSEELVLMLDANGDGTLSYENFIRSFYRLIDGGDFQQLCLMQLNINSIKHYIMEMKQHNMQAQDELRAQLQQLAEHCLGGKKAEMATQTKHSLNASASDAAELQESLAEEPSEPSVHGDDFEEFHHRCSRWNETLASLEDATAATRLKLCHYVEQVSAALEEAETLASAVSPPTDLKSSATSARAPLPSRRSAAQSTRRPRSPSAAQEKSLSPPESSSRNSASQATGKGAPRFDEHQHTQL